MADLAAAFEELGPQLTRVPGKLRHVEAPSR
jgi:hypothetical protein